MKITRFLVTSLAACSILLAACDKKPEESTGGGGGGAAVSEKAAIERFKKDVEEIKGMKKEGDAVKDQMAQMPMMKKVIAKVVAIKTDGLPADLKTDVAAMQGKMGEMGDILKDFPEKKEDMVAWVGKNPDFAAKMGKISQEGQAADEKLKATAKKYGIDMGD